MATASRRFVIQHHTGYGDEHWDLMLEDAHALMTWQLHRHPSTIVDGPIDATRIADHRKDYLTYEGAVGGNRGAVRIVDAGTYCMASCDAERMELRLRGGVLRGSFRLRAASTNSQRWSLTIQPSSD